MYRPCIIMVWFWLVPFISLCNTPLYTYIILYTKNVPKDLRLGPWNHILDIVYILHEMKFQHNYMTKQQKVMCNLTISPHKYIAVKLKRWMFTKKNTKLKRKIFQHLVQDVIIMFDSVFALIPWVILIELLKFTKNFYSIICCKEIFMYRKKKRLCDYNATLCHQMYTSPLFVFFILLIYLFTRKF